jgi:predicted ATP-grasp superfamily ATP-dependent carboligase
MKKAIVIGCHVCGLGVIRSLGLKGFQITAMSYDRTDFGHASKYVYERVEIPHPRVEEKDFIDFLIKNSYKWNGALIFDTNDEIAVSISKNKTELANYYKVITAEWGILRKFIEKPETYSLAEKCNVPYPKTFLPKTLDELYKIKNAIAYPCILKPVIGHEFMSKFNTKNFIVSNYNELLLKFELCLKSGYEVMIQEIIPGPDSNIYECMIYVNSEGYINTTFFFRKMRQNPPQFGVSRVAISQGRNPQIEDFTERILKEADFRGIATAEFKKDPRDNQFKLLEINVRAFRPNWLATYCGINFPWIIYMDLVEKEQVKVTDYKKDVYWIELYQDILNSVFRHNRENLGFRDYIKPYLSKNKTFAVLSADDFMPFLKQISILPIKYYSFFKSITSYGRCINVKRLF